MKVKELLRKVHPLKHQTVSINVQGVKEEELSVKEILELNSKYLNFSVCSLCLENGSIVIYCK